MCWRFFNGILCDFCLDLMGLNFVDLVIYLVLFSECVVIVWFFKKLYCKYSVVIGLRVKVNCWKILVEWIVVGNSCVIGLVCCSKELVVLFVVF